MSRIRVHAEKLYKLMFCKVCAFHGDRDLAHDAAVETWIALARNGSRAFESEGALIGYALFKAVRIALDLKRKRREITGCVLIEAIGTDDEADRLREEARHLLARARNRLPRFEQEIIALAYDESLPDRAIAEYLWGPVRGDSARKRVQRRRQRAERAIRSSLEEFGLDYQRVAVAFASQN
jgi:DNA-directed RNA polymerase specialized sigma24 family protein